MAEALPEGFTETSLKKPDLPPGYSEEPIAAPVSETQNMIDRIASLSAPPRSMHDVGEKVQTGLHLLPYAAAAAGPEGIAAGAAVQGVAGAAEEFGVQTIDHLSGKRKEYDWPAVGWNAGWSAAAGAVGNAVGKAISWATGAGKLATAAPEAQRLVKAGETVTPSRVGAIAQQASDELKSKTMLDSLGQKLGMTEDESAKLVGAYDEGRQVGDAVFQTDRMVQKEFGQRYDKILGPHNATPIDGTPLQTSIAKSKEWIQQSGNEGHVRPTVMAKLDEIAQGTAPAQIATLPDAMSVLAKSNVALPARATPDELVALANKVAGNQAPTVAQARGWQSELRDLSRTKSLTEVEDSVLATTERALNGTIADVVKAADPQAHLKLAATDADYGVFKSNFRTFWTSLKEKKSLSEVGDAIYDRMGDRPDALRYMLRAADSAGRMDDMRMAFLNKMWRESQTAGGAPARASAVNAYVSKFAPGAKGQDILQMILGKRPGITDSVGQFAQRIQDMGASQAAVKDPALANRLRRVMQYRLIIGGLAGGSLSYGAFHKDPITSLGIGLSVMAGIEGMSAVAKNPALNRMWVEWVSTNPNSPMWIERGARLVAQAGKQGIIPQPPTEEPK